MPGRATLEMDYSTVDAIVRFFPVEWLPNLPSACGGHAAYADADLAIAVAGDARSREVPWSDNEEWVLKPALGRVGEDIGMSGVTEAKQLKRVSRNVRWFPSGWAAQRRFAATAFRVREKDLYPSVGIYTIDGHAAGAYGRIAERPLIDGRARDAAVLVSMNDGEADARQSLPTPVLARMTR